MSRLHWIVRALRVGSRPRLACYLRENGPIAYALPLLDGDARSYIEALLDTGFSCYWRTGDETRAANRAEWTQVTRWSMGALLSDVSPERAGRPFTLVGFDSTEMPHDLLDDHVVAALRAFVADKEGALQLVVRRGIGTGVDGGADSGVDYVFVAQHPTEAVRGLMQAWGIDAVKADRRAYARLRTASLEDWLHLLTHR